MKVVRREPAKTCRQGIYRADDCLKFRPLNRYEAATGIYPDPQGIAYVLTPDGKGGFTVQASLKPDQWASF
ncbi:hypothetical protein [Synechococcus sp. CS-1327]|uniref:hypothetical protein n=1 Tax=Synechococcus sp. CS-1327 TaxID=2847977 RepID=UPI00223AE6CE|nr:hypothetical protein [Synechococcus sp. CS-1327]